MNRIRTSCKLLMALEQPVLVENRAGAAGMIGMQEVNRAAPASNTLVLFTHPSLPANSVKELIAHAKSQPWVVKYRWSSVRFRTRPIRTSRLAKLSAAGGSRGEYQGSVI